MLILVAVTVWLAAPQSARADRWYGWQTLSTDAFAYAELMVAVKRKSLLDAGIAVVTYVVAPPVVHLAHGEYARAGWSLGRRIALPLAGGAIGYVVLLPFDCDDCEKLSGPLGFLGGILANTVIDAVVARGSNDPADTMMFTVGGGF